MEDGGPSVTARWVAAHRLGFARVATDYGEPDPAASRGKVARLTPRGLDAQHLYHELTGTIERRWHDHFTPGVTGALRASLEPLAAGRRRSCPAGSSRIRTTGAPRSAVRPPCRTSRSCCTAAAIPTAADLLAHS